MDQKLLKRKAWPNDSGVSEIVGNILILMITVVLFSGIMMFVNQMPVPELTTKADFSASLLFDDIDGTAILSVTHVGGATMAAADTIVLVDIDGSIEAYRLSEYASFTAAEWAAGLKWTAEYSQIQLGRSSEVTVTVVDEVSHNAVWVSRVSGGMGKTPPVILQRYVDSNTATISIDPIKEDDNFTLFVKVADYDNNLASVVVDSSSLPGTGHGGAPTRPSVIDPDGGWYEWDFIEIADDASLIDGKVIMITATDSDGLSTVVPFEITVITLPSDIEYYPSDTTPQEGGMPSYIKNVNEGQGFAIFSMNVSSGKANLSDPRTNFTRGETVFIRAASMYVNNLEGGNLLTLRDARSGIYYTSSIIWYSLSNEDKPFYNYAYGGSVFVYECAFTTTHLLPGTYLMHAELSCTGAYDYTFVFDETLYIEDSDSPIDYYPKVWLSRDVSFNPTWGSTKAAAFNATGTNCKIFVGISVQDIGDPANAIMGEVRIVDMTGGTELYGPPGSGEMISDLDDSNSTSYYFYIDLRYSNGDAWKLGTNSYTLQIAQFSDDNEGVYAYSTQVYVRAPSARSDFLVGTNGIYSSLGGSTNFIAPEYVFHIQNNNFFTMRTLWQAENSPSTAPLYYHNAMCLADLDNDGDLDLLVGSNMDKSGSYDHIGRILYFENTLNTYGIWQSSAIITRPLTDDVTSKIKWIDAGDINGDGYTDFAYATTENKVWLFNNTYGATGARFPVPVNGTSSIRKIALEDMTGDGRADLIVLKEGVVHMYDLTKWTRGLFSVLPNPTVVSNPAYYEIVDFDIADMNNDGMLDIITVDADTSSDASIKGVWVNNYTSEGAEVDERTVEDDILVEAGYMDGDAADVSTNDALILKLYENETEVPAGRVEAVFTIDNTLSIYTDPQLCINASLFTGIEDPDDYMTEVFYVWYGYGVAGTDPDDVKYTPVIVISGDDYVTYTYPLPSTVSGKMVFIKITDSSTLVDDGLTEELWVNYIAVLSNRFGTYWPNPAISPSNRYLVSDLSAGETYTSARAINFDGLDDNELEVACAKNGKFAVHDRGEPYTTWTVSDANMYVRPTGSTGLPVFNAISPTLFAIEDVNGDGLDDIVTVRYSTGASDELSVVRLYVNVGADDLPWSIDVKDLFSGMPVGSEKGSIACIVLGDIYARS